MPEDVPLLLFILQLLCLNTLQDGVCVDDLAHGELYVLCLHSFSKSLLLFLFFPLLFFPRLLFLSLSSALRAQLLLKYFHTYL